MNTQKEIEKIKEVLNALMELVEQDSVNSRIRGIILTDLIPKLNQPTEAQPTEGYQGAGKWYVTKQGSIFYATKSIEGGRNSTVQGCGYNKPLNTWTINSEINCYMIDIERLATPEEIKAAILKGCEQHGIVKGARVKIYNRIHNLDIILESTYNIHTNQLWFYLQNGFIINVFDNGKFAEVVKDDKPTDKELLDEAVELLKLMGTNNLYYYKVQHFLTKIQTHKK